MLATTGSYASAPARLAQPPSLLKGRWDMK
jgi:hypothetical protein